MTVNILPVCLALGLALAVPSLASAQSVDRGGFTFLVGAGLGIQNDTGLEATATGFGLDLGIGGFINPKIAILGRIASTGASFDDELIDQGSGVFGATMQFWPNDRVGIEAGAGAGSWRAEDQIFGDDYDDSGLGLILGLRAALLNKGKHNLHVGFEYAPVFTSQAVHNFLVTFGYQLF